ncbi:cyclic nucleotide-binding domain-containing protein [Legionella waltersii]|nr:cyclic nucleotide-binding domain-containing protein [Legionella waltersii]
MITQLQHHILGELTESQLMHLFESAELIELKANTKFIHEGDKEPFFYYIIEGAVSIFIHSGKQQYVLATLLKGETVGEIALIDEGPRSASVKTLKDTKLYKFDINKLKSEPEFSNTLATLTKIISNQLSNRLRYTNAATVAALEKKYIMSIFSIRMLILLSVYALSLNLIVISKHYLPNANFISVSMILVYVVVLFSIVRQSSYPLSFYGFNKENLFKNCSEAILYSIPIMGLILLLKWWLIVSIPSLHHLALFDPSAIFQHGVTFSLKIYLISILLYSVFTPAQEFVVRGCIQTSLQHLLDGPHAQVKWKAIFISNLIFASAHSHLSMGFALSTFIPGIFWGWLFYRQKSLIGVSISHFLIGVWAVFFVGIQSII